MKTGNSRPVIIGLLIFVVLLAICTVSPSSKHNTQLHALTEAHNAQLWAQTEAQNAQMWQITERFNAQLWVQAAEFQKGASITPPFAKPVPEN